MSYPALQFLILTVTGWLSHQQLAVVEYLLEENRVLREQLEGRRLRLTNAQGRRLAIKGKALARRALVEFASIRFHGLFAPNARHRHLVVPSPPLTPASAEPQALPTRAAMTWAQRLRRVFEIDLSRCARCSAALRVLAVITDPRVIAAILAHLETRAARASPPARH